MGVSSPLEESPLQEGLQTGCVICGYIKMIIIIADRDRLVLDPLRETEMDPVTLEPHNICQLLHVLSCLWKQNPRVFLQKLAHNCNSKIKILLDTMEMCRVIVS